MSEVVNKRESVVASSAVEGEDMGLLEHLGELRHRLTWIAGILLATTILSFLFADRLLIFLIAPYGDQLQTIRVTESVETYFKVSLMAGAVLAMPLILWQVWKFIAPGLEKSEKLYAYIFIPSGTILFLVGVSFAWFVLLPAAVSFLGTFLDDLFEAKWTSQEYIGFVTGFLFWIGVSFEMPVVVYFVARLGVVTAQTLREQWRIAVVGIAVLAAAITPSIDPVTMLLTMAPLLVLYVLSWGVAVIGQRQFERAMALESEVKS